MELRNLRVFVVAARELHFTRAAEKLYISPATMTELIHRLESDVGTPLFIRTTRRVALTDAGAELLTRAESILDQVVQAGDAVRAIGRGESGVVRLGVTPPAAPVLAPHLAAKFSASDPMLSIETQRLWLPSLFAALRAGTIDAAVTCGTGPITDDSIRAEVIGREPLLVGLKPHDPMTDQAAVDLHQLQHRVLGVHPADLFPAWHNAQRDVLTDARIAPPTVELSDPDLNAYRWTQQTDVDWIMLTPSMMAGHAPVLIRPVNGLRVPFTLLWHDTPTIRPVTQRFVEAALQGDLPAGWLPGPVTVTLNRELGTPMP